MRSKTRLQGPQHILGGDLQPRVPQGCAHHICRRLLFGRPGLAQLEQKHQRDKTVRVKKGSYTKTLSKGKTRLAPSRRLQQERHNLLWSGWPEQSFQLIRPPHTP